MKRLELLKKTGIYITAAAISAALTVSTPVMTTFAASGSLVEGQDETGEDDNSRSSDGATDEPAKEDGNDSDNDDGDDSGDNGNDSGSDSDDSGNKEDDGKGSGTDNTDNTDNEDASGDKSGSGNTNENSDSGSGKTSGKSDGSGSGSTDGNSGSGKTDDSSESGKTKDESGSDKTKDDSGSGKSKDDSGSGKTSDPIPENQDGTGQENQNPQTADTGTPAVVSPTTTDTGLPLPVTPQNTAKTDKNKTIEERKTDLDPDEVPTGYDQALQYSGTNEQLIASQNIVSGLSIIRDDFRFFTVEKDLAFSSYDQSVYEDMKNGSRPVGSLDENDALYVLSEEKDDWLYIESGNVRGFIRANRVIRGDDAKTILKDLQEKLTALAALSGEKTPANAEALLKFAIEIIPAGENKAFAYKRCTTKSTLVDKEYAIAQSDSYILENASDDSVQIGRLSSGNLCYIIMQVNDSWVYVESGNARGFMRLSDLSTGKKALKVVKELGEESIATAEQLVTPSENKALYFTLNSVRDGIAYSNVRTEIVRIAAECIGNPYVWGGNSLTYGCDCSGFVKTLYSMFGYSLPRVADDQSRFGTQIPISEAAPGDLIFFASNGYVYHVALYAGDGMTIEAYSEERGIIATDIGNRDAVWATRVIED